MSAESSRRRPARPRPPCRPPRGVDPPSRSPSWRPSAPPAWGLFLAAAGVIVAAFGLLDPGARSTPRAPTPPRRDPSRTSRLRSRRSSGRSRLFVVAVRLASAGLLGVVPAPRWCRRSFLALVVAVHRLGAALGGPRRLLARRGFWVVAGATLLYLPLLGSTSLIDPWESHYGEVAREMIARDDWISPWWAQERWFWSKPVLDLWLEALSMRLSASTPWPARCSPRWPA